MDRDTNSERLHSTVRLNQFTLQFEDSELEKAYQAGLHPRKKALWLRSLLPAAAFQLIFALADGLDYPVEHLLVTVPTRVLLAMLQVATWLLVRWNLVRVREQTMLLVSVVSGIPTLLLYALQRTRLCQWDALFVTFGLSFYTIPKVTPLGYVSSLYGSWATAAVYTVLSFVVRPPLQQAESVLGISFLVPTVWVFNTIAYYSEYNSRERFALHRRLRRESITLAVARTSEEGGASRQGCKEDGWLLLHTLSLRGRITANTKNGTTSFVVAVMLWGALTLGSWTSLPDTLKFVDEDTGWAWFSHCAGVTVFLVVMTRRLRWLLVIPGLGSFVLWVMSLAMPASWIIVSAHSVGYGLLLASVVIAMGVFGWFLCAWRELVSFLTRSCFLYPQLQAGMEKEYPLLVRIVSEYTAGFDPDILNARVPTAIAIDSLGTRASGVSAVSPPQKVRSKKVCSKTIVSSVDQQSEKTKNNRLHKVTEERHSLGKDKRLAEAIPTLSGPSSEKKDAEVTTDDGPLNRKMVSVLPSFKPGKCFFCSKNDAEHFVPACGMWGKWTHWRMNQQHNLSNSPTASSGVVAKATVAVSMCTSYCDLQNEKSQLESYVRHKEDENASLSKELVACKERERKLSLENVDLNTKLRAMEERHAASLQRCEVRLKEKMEAVQKETNWLAHEHKRRAKTSEAAQVATLRKQLVASKFLVKEAHTRVQSANEEAALLRSKLTTCEEGVVEWKSKAEEYKKQLLSMKLQLQQHPPDKPSPRLLGCSPSSATIGESLVNAAPVATLQTLQPVGRLPYAQSLEIEGLRESSRHSHDNVDYAKRWRLFQDYDIGKRVDSFFVKGVSNRQCLQDEHATTTQSCNTESSSPSKS